MPDPRREVFPELEKAEMLDDFLLRLGRARGATCMTHSVTLYWPVEHPKAESWARRLADTMTELFGGSTTWDGVGTWCDRPSLKEPCRGPIERERVKVIESYHRCTEADRLERFVRELKQAAEETDQVALAIGGTGFFVVVPTRKFRPPQPRQPRSR